MDARTAKAEAEDEGAKSRTKYVTQMKRYWLLLILVGFVLLVTWQVHNAVEEHNTVTTSASQQTAQAPNTAAQVPSPQVTTPPAAEVPTESATAEPAPCATVTLAHAVSCDVITEAVFKRDGPKEKATCLFPGIDSGAYKKVKVKRDSPDDPNGVESIHVWVKDPHTTVTAQLQYWGSNCEKQLPDPQG